jgi:hypothetical protein
MKYKHETEAGYKVLVDKGMPEHPNETEELWYIDSCADCSGGYCVLEDMPDSIQRDILTMHAMRWLISQDDGSHHYPDEEEMGPVEGCLTIDLPSKFGGEFSIRRTGAYCQPVATYGEGVDLFDTIVEAVLNSKSP